MSLFRATIYLTIESISFLYLTREKSPAAFSGVNSGNNCLSSAITIACNALSLAGFEKGVTPVGSTCL